MGEVSWTFCGVNPLADRVSSVVDMTNTPWPAAQCIRFYERPPRKRGTRERNDLLDEGWPGRGRRGAVEAVPGRFYYVILLMHSGPVIRATPRENMMSLRSGNRP